MRLQDKVTVITGAGAGMGRAIAELFAEEGARLILGEIDQTRLDEVMASVEAKGADAVGALGNVAVKADAEGFVSLAVSRFGRIDVLINNAGILDRWQGIGEVQDDVWERVMGVNLMGTMYTTRKAVQYMRKSGGGSIVNVSSTAAMSGANAGAAYTTSKTAVVGLTRNTAWMYTLENIRCNAICPGGVMTPLAKSIDPALLDPLGVARCGLGHSTMPKTLEIGDVAKLALFLAGDESSYINGQIIAADHGWTAV